MISYFSKILKKFEVGQLHGLVGCMTEQTRENAKYMIPTKLQDAQKEVAQLQNFKKISLLLYMMCKRVLPLFFHILF